MTLGSNRFSRRGMRALALSIVLAGTGLVLAAPAGAAGMFAIGDQNAAVGSSVTFWGAKWWKLNALSGGDAPAAFKGWANTLDGTSCPSSWSTDPGNSSEPPEGPLPGLIEVLVPSTVTKSGKVISGNSTEVALVRTDPGYAANPGHAGTGTVVAVVCKPETPQQEEERKRREEEEKRKHEEEEKENEIST
jgi:hypothetical protein